MEKNTAYATPGDIAVTARTESPYIEAFPAEMREEVRKNYEAAKEAGKAYAHSEEAGDASLAYLVGAMSGPGAELLDNPMACMAIGRVFRSSPKSEWEKYYGMSPEELVRLDAGMCGGDARWQELSMINKLHLEMIQLYSGDVKRIQHFCKVHSYAKLIAESENVDAETLFILETAALTHDIAIHCCEEKYGSCNGKLQEKEGAAIAERLLDDLHFEKRVSERVQYLIAHHHTYDNIDGIDYQILVEADFLVNLYEDGLSAEAAEHAYKKIFRTDSGKNLCRAMFHLNLD